MTRKDFPAGPLGDRALEIAQHNSGYGLQALADAADELDRRACRASRLFFAQHREFTWVPRLCRWPDRGWSVWWLWFEVAELVKVSTQMLNDYQTSEQHHPDHVLVPRTAFEGMLAALAKIGGDA